VSCGTNATLARDAGVPLKDVQDGLGHADPAPPAGATTAAPAATGHPATGWHRSWPASARAGRGETSDQSGEPDEPNPMSEGGAL
jgi:hypothetical protein